MKVLRWTIHPDGRIFDSAGAPVDPRAFNLRVKHGHLPLRTCDPQMMLSRPRRYDLNTSTGFPLHPDAPAATPLLVVLRSPPPFPLKP